MAENDVGLLRSNRRVVLIGSMGVYGEIVECARLLSAAGIETIVPEQEDLEVQRLSTAAFENFKRKVSFAYLKKIRHPRTYCVLAVNLDRHGIMNYVGPNTFAEIAVAFAQSKKIYLLQGVPDAYSDELSAWRAVPLRGDLERFTDIFREDCMSPDPQKKLFE